MEGMLRVSLLKIHVWWHLLLWLLWLLLLLIGEGGAVRGRKARRVIEARGGGTGVWSRREGGHAGLLPIVAHISSWGGIVPSPCTTRSSSRGKASSMVVGHGRH